MSAVGPDGVEWVSIRECLERIPGLNGWTVRSWLRGRAGAAPRVRSVREDGSVFVAWNDVLAVEAAADRAGWRRGRRADHSR